MQKINFDKQANADKFKRLPLKLSVNKDNGNQLSGYVVVWDVLSTDRGGYYGLFPKGSMVLPTYPITMLYNPNDNWLLVTEHQYSLSVGEGDHGVPIGGTLEDTFIEQFVKTKMVSGVIKGMSVGMYALQFHNEMRVVTPQDAAGNTELIPLIGQTVEVEVYDQWLIDEVTITGRPSLPQTDIALLAKKIEG